MFIGSQLRWRPSPISEVGDLQEVSTRRKVQPVEKHQKFVKIYGAVLLAIPVAMEMKSSASEIWRLIVEKEIPEGNWKKFCEMFVTERKGLLMRGRPKKVLTLGSLGGN